MNKDTEKDNLMYTKIRQYTVRKEVPVSRSSIQWMLPVKKQEKWTFSSMEEEFDFNVVLELAKLP